MLRNVQFGLMLALAAVGSSATFAEDATVHLDLVTSGALRLTDARIPKQLKMAPEKPATLINATKWTAPSFGLLPFGGEKYIVALDSPASGAQTLRVDANGNGDLTDDPAVHWEQIPVEQTGGQVVHMGDFMLPLHKGGKDLAALKIIATEESKDALIYLPDYILSGKVAVDGKTHKALLTDVAARGDFRAPAPTQAGGEEENTPPPHLLLDLNDDGKFDLSYEALPVNAPFNIGGKNWEIADMTADGTFKIVASSKTAEPIVTPPDLGVGAKIPAFKATTMDGKAVDFPNDYKGKLVMLDFWATWCGPCMDEMPNLVASYKQAHGHGLEVLGISFDEADNAEGIKGTEAQLGMTWPQIYEGKKWETKIGTQYGIHSIPAGFLVDGDTGEILATGDTLRGRDMLPTIQAALAKKFKAGAK